MLTNAQPGVTISLTGEASTPIRSGLPGRVSLAEAPGRVAARWELPVTAVGVSHQNAAGAQGGAHGMGVDTEAGSDSRQRPTPPVEVDGASGLLIVKTAPTQGHAIAVQVLRHGGAVDPEPARQLLDRGPRAVTVHEQRHVTWEKGVGQLALTTTGTETISSRMSAVSRSVIRRPRYRSWVMLDLRVPEPIADLPGGLASVVKEAHDRLAQGVAHQSVHLGIGYDPLQ